MGALVVLTVGVFSSCKDYDDEINANKASIKELRSQLDALKKAQENCAAECQLRKQEAAAAQATADKAVKDAEAAQKAADAAQKAADAAQGTADQAVKDAEAAQKAAEAAQKAADAAQSAADAAAALAKSEAAAVKAEVLKKLADDLADLEARIAEKYETKADFEAAIAKYTTTEELNKLLAGIETKIANLRTDMENGDKALEDKYNLLKGTVDEIYKDYITQGKLDAALAVLEARIMGAVDGVDQKVIALSSIVNTNRDSIAINAAAIVALEQTVKQIEVNRSLIDALTLRVGKIEADYVTSEDLTQQYRTITAEYTSAIAAATDALEESLVDEENGVLKNLYARMKAVETKAQENKDAIDGLADDMNKLNQKMTQRIDSLAKVTKALEANKADKDKFDALKKLVEETYGPQITEVWDWYGKVKANVDKISGMLQDIQNLKAQKLDKSVFEAKVRELEAKDKLLLDSITKHRGDIDKLTRDLASAVARIDAAEKAIAKLQSDVNVLTLFINKNLTSIVTKPDTWLYGLPRIDADVVEAQTFGFKGFGKATAGDNFQARNGYSDPFEEQATAGHSVELTAKYWLNPSTTNWEEYTYSMDEVPTTSTITRGNRDDKPAVPINVRATDYTDGVLTVKFKFQDGGNVNDAKTIGRVAGEGRETYAWITAVALQAKRINTADENAINLEDNRVITSDYAIVAPNYIKKLILGNEKYKATGHNATEGDYAPEGNNNWHLNTSYAHTVAEDYAGVYSFELYYDDSKVIDLNDTIDTHYFTLDEEGNLVEANDVWDYAKIKEKDFDYKYTLLETDENKGVWNLDGSKISIAAGKGVPANTGNDKAAVIRVELVSKLDKKTYAFGYVSILMMNHDGIDSLKLDSLRLDCDGVKMVNGDLDGDVEFSIGMTWAGMIAQLEEKLGTEIDWDLQDFIIENQQARGTSQAETTGAPLVKYTNSKCVEIDETHLGTITFSEGNLTWSFTHEEALEAFYEEDGITPKEKIDYNTWVKIEPNEAGENQGVAAIVINISIAGVIFPEAGWGFDQRLMGNWYLKQNKEISPTHGPEQYEIHASVEVPDEVRNNWIVTDAGETVQKMKKTDDRFHYDMSVTFRKNTFSVLPSKGFVYKDAANNIDYNVSAYFDASKYYVKPATLAEGSEIKTSDWSAEFLANTTAIGAKGDLYLLYLTDPLSDKLMAIKAENGKFYYGGATHAAPQPVVQLSGYDEEKNISNFVATFMKYTYYTGNNAEDYSYAYDLLNAAPHSQLAPITAAGADYGKMTFTSHMILRITDYCLPVKYIDEGNKFDIRYLRPISINEMENHTVYDAIDGAFRDTGEVDPTTGDPIYELNLDHNNVVHLADLVSFIDWRDVKFTSKTGMKYLNYYGVKSINPNLDKAMCDLDHLDPNGGLGTFEYIKEVSDKIQFTHVTIGESEPSDDRTYEQFREEVGYFLYQNHQSTTETFHIKLPITIVYHWGETASKDVIITVTRTLSNARVK
jgi:hypothetical protein